MAQKKSGGSTNVVEILTKDACVKGFKQARNKKLVKLL